MQLGTVPVRAKRHRSPHGGWALLQVWLLTLHAHWDAHTTEASVGLGDGRAWGLRFTVTGHRWGQRSAPW